MNIQDKYTDSLKNRLNYAEENAEKVAEEEEKLKRAAQKEAIESEGRGPLLTNEEYDEKLLNENEFGQTGFNSDFQGPTLEPTDAERFEQIKDYDPRTEMPLLAVKGVIDTGANLADSPLNPLIEPTKWISGQERPYHALWSSLVPYKEDNDIDQTIRNLSGLIIPTMFGYGAVGAASKAVSANVMIGSGAKTIAELAARLGVDMTVAYHAGGSEHDANAAQTLNEAFGWNLPNATSDDDLPALRREKHRNEAVGMFAFSELLGLGGKLYRSVFPKGADAASQAIVDAAPKVNPEDPITSAHSIVKAERDTIFDEEVIRRMEAGPGNVGPYGEVTPGNVTASAEVLGMPRQKYDPFIHTKYAEPHETYIPNQGANAIDAKIDTAEKIYNPNYPQNGRSVPIVTEHIEKKHLNIKTAGARRDALYEVYESASPSVKAVKDGLMKYTPEEVNKAVDILYDIIAL